LSAGGGIPRIWDALRSVHLDGSNGDGRYRRAPGGEDSDTAEVFCFAINNAGNVVGRARQVDGRQVAFFWSPTDGFTTLWHHSTNSDNGDSAYAINDLDQVTGNLNVNKHGAGRSRIWGRCGLR